MNENNHLLLNKNVLEIGAGLGLVGIVCSKYCNHITMTDYNEIVLQALKKNIEINTKNININDEDYDLLGSFKPFLTNSDNIGVNYLDWDTLQTEPFTFSYIPISTYGKTNELKVVSVENKELNEELNIPLTFSTIDKNQQYDIIVASDMICCESDAIGIAKSVKKFLKENGICLFVIPQPQFRYGCEVLIPALTAIGLQVVSRTITNSQYKNELYTKSQNDDESKNMNQYINDILNSDITNDEYLTNNIHDNHYIAWNFIVAQW